MMTIQTSAPATAANATTPPAANGPDAVLLALAPDDAAAATLDGAALPALFAQLLNQAGQPLPDDAAPDAAAPSGAAGAASGASPAADGRDATTPDSGAPADGGAVLSAMAASMLAIAVPPLAAVLAAPAPAPGATDSGGGGADASRIDAVGASATGSGAVLNAASTRLNLAAAGVAVMPAAPAAAPAAAPSAATNTPAATVASNAAAGASPTPSAGAAPPAVAGTDLAPPPSPAPAASLAGANLAAASGAQAATAMAADAAVPSTSAAQAGARAARPGDGAGSDYRAANSTSTAASASASPLGATKDDSIIGAARVTPAPTPSGVNGSYTQAPQLPQDNGAAVKLAGAPDQWQQPLREALGDRLQLQLQRNDNQAVIRLDPPNMGRIEISIRHSAGTLQVNLSANNSEVLRQLNTIGDSVRQDLSQRQFSDVAVTVSAARAGQGQADADGRGRQQRDADDGRTPGRALSDDSAAGSFAMLTERE